MQGSLLSYLFAVFWIYYGYFGYVEKIYVSLKDRKMAIILKTDNENNFDMFFQLFWIMNYGNSSLNQR